MKQSKELQSAQSAVLSVQQLAQVLELKLTVLLSVQSVQQLAQQLVLS